MKNIRTELTPEQTRLVILALQDRIRLGHDLELEALVCVAHNLEVHLRFAEDQI
jgi:hypothetical protein